MPGRLQQLDERRGDLRQPAIDPLRQRLHHEIVAVAIDDQRRQPIGFAVDEPVRGRVERQRLAVSASRPRAARATNVGGGAAGPSAIMRSVISDRSLKSAWPTTRPRVAGHADEVAGVGLAPR